MSTGLIAWGQVRVDVPEMCVSQRDVWFHAIDADAHICTRALPLEDLARAHEEGVDAMVVCWGDEAAAKDLLEAAGAPAGDARVVLCAANGVHLAPRPAAGG